MKKITDQFRAMPLEVKASTAYAVCSILQRCMSFITLPLFTRLLTTQQYGQYNVYTSWSSILTIFITLNLAYGSFSTAMIRFEEDRPGYIAAVQNVCVVLAAVFFAIYLPFRQWWNGVFEMSTPLVCLMVVDVLAQFALLCWYGVRRFAFQYKSVIAVTLLIAVVSPLIAYFMVINSQERGVARIFGYALFGILVGTIIFVYNAIRGGGGFNRKYWRFALGFNIPLIPYYLSQVVFNESDRIMISHISGTDKAGIYGVAYTLATLLTFVLNAINNSYVPWFYGRIKEGKGEENRSVSCGIAGLMAFLLLGVIALAPEIIGILAGKAYREAVWVVPPVAMSMLLLFYSQLFINLEFYYEEKTMLVWGSIASALLNILLNYLLIPMFGFVAAGYTTLASYIVFALANYFTMKLVLKKRNIQGNFFDLKLLIWIFLIFTGLSFAALALYELPLIRFAIILLVLLAVFIKRKAAVEFVKSVLVRK